MIIRTAKLCSRCKNQVLYPGAGLTFRTVRAGTYFDRKLCAACVEKGWHFDEKGKIYQISQEVRG
jgi:hypothetical protein